PCAIVHKNLRTDFLIASTYQVNFQEYISSISAFIEAEGLPMADTGNDTKRSRWAGALIGIGMMAAVDEIIFHQLLGWHHFFDSSTPAIGLLSDGILHSAELVSLIVGFFLL